MKNLHQQASSLLSLEIHKIFSFPLRTPPVRLCLFFALCLAIVHQIRKTSQYATLVRLHILSILTIPIYLFQTLSAGKRDVFQLLTRDKPAMFLLQYMFYCFSYSFSTKVNGSFLSEDSRK